MAGRALRAGAWCGASVLVVLAARVLSYAVAPQATVLSLQLERSVGGPRLLVVAAWSLGLAAAAASLVVGLAVLAVRERLVLERSVVISPPRLRPLRFCRRYVLLLVVTCAAFTLLESYLHWRAGLGWHGLRCLTGPVHRDAVPLLAALGLVAVACFEAVGYLLEWSRRTLGRFAPAVPAIAAGLPEPFVSSAPPPRRRPCGGQLPPRGPPIPFRSRAAARAAPAT